MAIDTPDPKTWADDDLLTANDLNTEIRDALRFMSSGCQVTVKLASDFTIPTGVRTNITWSQQVEDTDGVITMPGDTFTFARDGVVALRLVGVFDSGSTVGARNFIAIVNGNEVAATSDSSAATEQNSATMTVDFPVEAGDTLVIAGFQNSGGNVNIKSGTTRANVTWVGITDAVLPDDLTPPPPAPSPSGPPTSNTPTKHTATFLAEWSRSYDESRFTTWDDSRSCYQGRYDRKRGNTSSLVGFDSKRLVDLLEHAQRISMKLTIRCDHSFYNSGMTVVLGGHKYAGKPGAWGFAYADVNIQRFHIDKNNTKTITLESSIRDKLRSGTYKGIMFGPGRNSTRAYYGFMNGASQNSKPKLVVTYYK